MMLDKNSVAISKTKLSYVPGSTSATAEWRSSNVIIANPASPWQIFSCSSFYQMNLNQTGDTVHKISNMVMFEENFLILEQCNAIKAFTYTGRGENYGLTRNQFL